MLPSARAIVAAKSTGCSARSSRSVCWASYATAIDALSTTVAVVAVAHGEGAALVAVRRLCAVVASASTVVVVVAADVDVGDVGDVVV